MGLEDLNTVDAIGLERESGAAVLTLIDSWDWRDEENHLDALQSKLNAYFNFIESGQIGETHPQAVGRKLFIDVVTQHALSDRGKLLLKHVSDFAAERNVGLRCKQVKSLS